MKEFRGLTKVESLRIDAMATRSPSTLVSLRRQFHLTRSEEGRRRTIILTNFDKVGKIDARFAIPYNVNFIVNPQETKSVTFRLTNRVSWCCTHRASCAAPGKYARA